MQCQVSQTSETGTQTNDGGELLTRNKTFQLIDDDYRDDCDDDVDDCDDDNSQIPVDQQ